MGNPFVKLVILLLTHALLWGILESRPLGAAFDFVKVFSTMLLWAMIVEYPQERRRRRQKKEEEGS